MFFYKKQAFYTDEAISKLFKIVKASSLCSGKGSVFTCYLSAFA